MRTAQSCLVVVAVVLVVASPVGPARGGPARCVVEEGGGIAGVRVGMPATAALAVAGPPLREQTTGTQLAYTLRPPWSQMTVEYALVRRVSTRAPECVTSRGLRPGAAASDVRAAYADAPASLTAPAPDGDLLTYPFAGIAFLLRAGRVDAIEVFAKETMSRAAQPTPAPTAAAGGSGAAAPPPQPPGAAGIAAVWTVRVLSVRVQQTTLVVDGALDNHGRAQNVYAEVLAYGDTGRVVGEDNAPVHPNPVPNGKTAEFQVRVAIDDVAFRYRVVIRPFGQVAGALAEITADIHDLTQFTAVVARRVQAQVRPARTPPTQRDFVVAVTNNSSLTLSSVAVYVELTANCGVSGGAIRLTMWRGTATVMHISPGGIAETPLLLSDAPCAYIQSWSVTARVVDVTILDPTPPRPPLRNAQAVAP